MDCMTAERIALFESEKISSAILKLAVPTVLSSLVTTFYSLADTFFVGMLNNSIQNAAVTLCAPALLAFNAVTNLFGVGGGSMMSRALGRKDYATAVRSSAFSFFFSILAGIAYSSLRCCALDPECRHGLSCQGRGKRDARQHRDNDRLRAEHHP